MHRVVFGSMGSMKPRSGSYNDPWHSQLNPAMNLPELRQIPDRLSDLLDHRAIELFQVAKSQHKGIYIM